MTAKPSDSEEHSAFAEAAESVARKAAASGFPAFLTAVAQSSPLNATPYVFRYADFRTCLLSLGNRERPLAALADVIADARTLEIEVVLILVGGSILNRDSLRPHDIDCVLLYRTSHRAVSVDARQLAQIQRRGVSKGADVRFVPLDGDPLVVVKAVSFFTSLFGETKRTVGRSSNAMRPGLALVDCRVATSDN